jgi:hypothetical protein
VRKGSERPRKSPCVRSDGVNDGTYVTEEGRSKREPVAKTKVKSKRKRFSKRPPDGPFGANAAWIHGGCGTPEYRAYTAAKTLCTNPKNPRWSQYGARGIGFRFSSFVSFLEHLGRRPAGKVLDRIDRDGHFAPGNVYWRRKHHKKRCTPKAKTRKTVRIIVKKAPRVKPVNVCGHPERRHYAKGKCWPCYKAALRADGRLFQRVNAACHPDRPHMAKGLCSQCYAATPARRAWQNAYAAARNVRPLAVPARSTPADTRISLQGKRTLPGVLCRNAFYPLRPATTSMRPE